MNSKTISLHCCILLLWSLPTVQAEEVAYFPTIRVMAESELREEVGFVPFQEDKKVRQVSHNIVSIKLITIYRML